LLDFRQIFFKGIKFSVFVILLFGVFLFFKEGFIGLIGLFKLLICFIPNGFFLVSVEVWVSYINTPSFMLHIITYLLTTVCDNVAVIVSVNKLSMTHLFAKEVANTGSISLSLNIDSPIHAEDLIPILDLLGGV